MKTRVELKALLATLLAPVLAACLSVSSQAQVILNEANATSEDNFLATDPGKLYEGFDFGKFD